MKITRTLQIDLARWNGGVERARRAYYEQPIAACYYRKCFRLCEPGEGYCAVHQREVA